MVNSRSVLYVIGLLILVQFSKSKVVVYRTFPGHAIGHIYGYGDGNIGWFWRWNEKGKIIFLVIIGNVVSIYIYGWDGVYPKSVPDSSLRYK